MHSSRMRTDWSSSCLLGVCVCLSACWDTPPPVCAWETPLPGVGLKTPPPQARPLNFPPGCGPGDPPTSSPLGCGAGDLQGMLGDHLPPPRWTDSHV